MQVETRPQIKLQPGTTDKVLEASCWVTFAALCAFAIWSYFKLPPIIPIHFNLAGEPDNYGSKGAILILPCIAAIILMMLTAINRYPHIFNYPCKITEQNAAKQYTLATRLIRSIKLGIVLTFSLILVAMVHAANSSRSLGVWLIPSVTITMFLPLIWYFVQVWRNK